MIRHGHLALGALVAGLVFAPAAGARIAPGQAIAGVHLDDPQDVVRATLGAPRRVVPPGWEFGAPLRGAVTFDSRQRVNLIRTRSHGQRTSRRIGPGSKQASLKRAYPKAACHVRSRGRSLCILRARFHDRPAETDFSIARGRVTQVTVFFP
jgi:hypothetical protein